MSTTPTTLPGQGGPAGEGAGTPRIVGRYALYDEIAAGGMATVHIGRLLGPVGFSRTVAIKRLHPQFARDPEFVAMFLDEARLAARIRHPNVVPTLDVVALEQELFLVMEYVQGESLSRLVKASRKGEAAAPLNLVTTVMAGVLHGLHAAHEAKTERGEPLAIVHRDVSPQNVLVGIDGVARVLDFGVAKAAYRAQTTREGQIKGKVAYMPPEQIKSERIDRRVDVYAAAAVLWEAVTRRRLYQADSDAALLALVLFEPPPLPSSVVPGVPPELERIIMRGLARDPDQRYATARDMALELEACLPVASTSAIGGWVERLAGDAIATRARRITDIESVSSPVTAILPGAIAAPAPVDPAPAPPAPAREPAAGDDVTGPAAAVSKVGDGPRADPTPWQRARVPVLAACGALLLGGAIAALRAVSHGPDAPAQPAATGEAAPPPASAAPAPAPTPATAAPEKSADAPPPRPAASPAAPSPRPASVPRTPSAPVAPATPRPAAASCTPPYTIDGAGIRHMKPECLR
jgi:eukaryotic-like serine/threonine-protein kinase